MKLAFVIRLGRDSQPADGIFEGWVEEVDSCTEVRFRSTNELLAFLGQRFDLVTSAAGKPADNTRKAPVPKTCTRKGSQLNEPGDTSGRRQRTKG